MSWQVTVHKFKYSQQSRRKMLRKLCKQHYIKFLGHCRESLVYEIIDIVAMEEYKKRKGVLK